MTRKLIAEGHCEERHTDFCVVFLKILETGDEFFCEIPHDKVPKGMMTGSFVRLYEDSTELELFEPVWTAEEIAEIEKRVKELEDILDF